MENTQNEDNNITRRNNNRYVLMAKYYTWCKVFLYVLLLEFVIYLFIKITFYLFNKIKNVKREQNETINSRIN